MQMIAIRLQTANGKTYHVQPEDRMPVGNFFPEKLKSIEHVQLTPDMYDELRADESAAARAVFMGEVAS